MSAEKIIEKELADLASKSFLNYGTSVNVSRAIPDIRDGLKPVQRRVLESMRDMKVFPDEPKKKSARIIGHMIGAYHPHGDSSSYETMARMAQDFSYRYPLVEGQGNFGSIDGDAPAAMRYTEAQMTNIAMLMLQDYEKDVVDKKSNYDDKELEAVVLPSRIPHLLVNGTSGVAVGMTTEIPPHNLGEVIEGVIAYIKNSKISLDEMMKHIPAPDFPTGGVVIGKEKLKNAYATGKGPVEVRGQLKVEQDKSNTSIIITELPYSERKPNLIERIVSLSLDEVIPDIVGVNDESDQRTGMRIVINLKKNTNPEPIIELLYKHTSLKKNYTFNCFAIVNGKPTQVGLLDMIHHYVEFQRDVLRRRSTFEKNNFERRKHVLEAVVLAKLNLEKVIEITKKARNATTFRKMLRQEFQITEKQAQAILDLRLQRLTSLEIEKVEKELRFCESEIKRLTEIIGNKKKVDALLTKELREIKKLYSDERRTEILDNPPKKSKVVVESAKEPIVVLITEQGYIHSASTGLANSQNDDYYKLKNKDLVMYKVQVKDEEAISLVTNEGTFYKVDYDDIHKLGNNRSGVHLNTLTNKGGDIQILYASKTSEDEEIILFVTKNGLIKKLDASIFKVLRNGSTVTRIVDGDELIAVYKETKNHELVVLTTDGMVLRTQTDKVRAMGRTAAGVNLINLNEEANILKILPLEDEEFLVVATSQGLVKKTPLSEIRTQARGTKGRSIGYYKGEDGVLANGCLATEKDVVLFKENSDIVLEKDMKGIIEGQPQYVGVKIEGLEGKIITTMKTK